MFKAILASSGGKEALHFVALGRLREQIKEKGEVSKTSNTTTT